jgi:hypothetical protein
MKRHLFALLPLAADSLKPGHHERIFDVDKRNRKYQGPRKQNSFLGRGLTISSKR